MQRRGQNGGYALILLLLIGTALTAFLVVKEYESYSTKGSAGVSTSTSEQQDLLLDNPLAAPRSGISPLAPINAAQNVQDQAGDYNRAIQQAGMQ